MRILWFNWRDKKNPSAGGAEVFTHEVMVRLAKMGHELTLFSSEFPSSPRTETIDGIKIIRDGGRFLVYERAKKFYQKNDGLFDIIIDEINTKPFLTPKFVKRKKPIFALFHQLAKEFWFYETSFPLNYLGYYYLEKRWLSYYRDIPTITISNSSRMDLVALGFSDVTVIPQGLSNISVNQIPEKGSDPIILFVGRLKKAKLPDHAIVAFSIIKQEFPNAKMWIVGDGYMLEKLRKMDNPDVTLYGFVANATKYNLMQKAHLLLMPAVREGWGLVVTEANAMGTPAVAYNVAGIRDSISHLQTGILTKNNTPTALAESAIELLKDRFLLHKISQNAIEFSKQYNWDRTAQEFNKVISNGHH